MMRRPTSAGGRGSAAPGRRSINYFRKEAVATRFQPSEGDEAVIQKFPKKPLNLYSRLRKPRWRRASGRKVRAGLQGQLQ